MSGGWRFFSLTLSSILKFDCSFRSLAIAHDVLLLEDVRMLVTNHGLVDLHLPVNLSLQGSKALNSQYPQFAGFSLNSLSEASCTLTFWTSPTPL